MSFTADLSKCKKTLWEQYDLYIDQSTSKLCPFLYDVSPVKSQTTDTKGSESKQESPKASKQATPKATKQETPKGSKGKSTGNTPSTRSRALIVCEVCNETFKTIAALNTHKLKHSSESKHIVRCEIAGCDRTFSSKQGLAYHLTVHSREDPLLQCSKCPKTFKGQAQLNRHEAAHNLSKNPCDYCGRGSQRPSDKTKHEKVCLSNPKREIKCHYCKITCYGPENHETHRLTHLSCEHCEELFKSPGEKKNHVDKLCEVVHGYDLPAKFEIPKKTGDKSDKSDSEMSNVSSKSRRSTRSNASSKSKGSNGSAKSKESDATANSKESNASANSKESNASAKSKGSSNSSKRTKKSK